MPKQTDSAETLDSAAPAEPAAPAAFPLSLDEFCTRLSGTDRRVEMIGAFAHEERAAGRLKDTEAAYRQRFAAFASRPA